MRTRYVLCNQNSVNYIHFLGYVSSRKAYTIIMQTLTYTYTRRIIDLRFTYLQPIQQPQLH